MDEYDFYAAGFYFSFEYYNYSEPYPVGDRAWAKAAVCCVVADHVVEAEAWAFCSIDDEYDPGVGEGLALRRALKELNLTDWEKQDVRQAYNAWARGE